MHFFSNPGWQRIGAPMDIGRALRELALEPMFLGSYDTL
jgi:hypothetical protein